MWKSLFDSFHKKKCDKLDTFKSEGFLWSLAKNMLHNFCHSSVLHLLHPDGIIATSTREKAHVFVSLFSNSSAMNVPCLPPSSKSALSNPVSHFQLTSKMVTKFAKATASGKCLRWCVPRVLRGVLLSLLCTGFAYSFPIFEGVCFVVETFSSLLCGKTQEVVLNLVYSYCLIARTSSTSDQFGFIMNCLSLTL